MKIPDIMILFLRLIIPEKTDELLPSVKRIRKKDEKERVLENIDKC